MFLYSIVNLSKPLILLIHLNRPIQVKTRSDFVLFPLCVHIVKARACAFVAWPPPCKALPSNQLTPVTPSLVSTNYIQPIQEQDKKRGIKQTETSNTQRRKTRCRDKKNLTPEPAAKTVRSLVRKQNIFTFISAATAVNYVVCVMRPDEHHYMPPANALIYVYIYMTRCWDNIRHGFHRLAPSGS